MCADIEKDPLPYMMLLTGASYPRTFKDEDEMIYLLSEHDLDALDIRPPAIKPRLLEYCRGGRLPEDPYLGSYGPEN